MLTPFFCLSLRPARDNAITAAALAHYLFDPAFHTNDYLAYYLVGEGVGLGVIDNGHLVNGAQGAGSFPPMRTSLLSYR